MSDIATINKKDLVFPELSYQIVGASFNVFNELGWGLPEKQYQMALAQELKNSGIDFKREVYIPLNYKEIKIGRYFADFVINNQILLELKVVKKFGYAHTKQTLGYLRSAGLKLGILIYFSPDGVKYRRVLNSDV